MTVDNLRFDSRMWTPDAAERQNGKVVLITGSNTGVGFATACALARKGARVIMACRNLDKGTQALTHLRTLVSDADCSLVALDLASLESVRRCAAAIRAAHPRLDVLLNNAGVMMTPPGRTADGFETQFGTNVLGHFALTGLLLPLLAVTARSRVVTVSSIAHWVGRIDFENLNAERKYSSRGAYAQSKLANLVLAYELERRLRRTELPTISLAAHPGGTNSDLGRHRLLLRMVSPLMQSVEDGALPSLRATVDPQARGGEYYGPARFATFAGPPVKQSSSRHALDETVAAKLWRTCENLTDVRYLGQGHEPDNFGTGLLA